MSPAVPKLGQLESRKPLSAIVQIYAAILGDEVINPVLGDNVLKGDVFNN